jgi:membrane fusion protein (multidrug efflux system)
LSAIARVKEADLAYSRTTIAAPVSGHAKRARVQVGQRIAPGAPLMAMISLDDVWVDANSRKGNS